LEITRNLPVGEVRLDTLFGDPIDAGKPYPLELDHLTDLGRHLWFADSLLVPFRSVQDAGKVLFFRKPLDNGGPVFACLSEGVTGVAGLAFGGNRDVEQVLQTNDRSGGELCGGNQDRAPEVQDGCRRGWESRGETPSTSMRTGSGTKKYRFARGSTISRFRA
jgi:hypothetical protein